jgi:hypothetical protein
MKILTNKFFILGNLILILAAIPLTLFFVKKQQDLQSSAAPSSKLYFQPASVNTQTGCTSFTMDVMIDPGTNIPAFVNLQLTYDPTLVEVTQLTPSSAFNIVQTDASISNGTARIGVDSVGGAPDPAKYITTVTKVVTVTFVPKGAGTATIKFGNETTVRSLDVNGDAPYTNVLSSSPDGTAVVTSGTCSSGVGNPPVTTSVTPPPTTISISPGIPSSPPTATISASITPIASASPTISIPTPIPTVIIPTATPIPPTPTLVQKPTIAPTGTLSQTIGLVAAVVFVILGGMVLLAL